MTIQTAESLGMTVSCHGFGQTPDGETVERYQLANRSGMTVDIITFGARVQAIHVPDRNGQLADVVLGFDDIAGYIAHQDTYFGATIGRFGNRIAGGQFSLNDTSYTLPTNNGPNTLHGGTTGFDAHVWAASPIDTGQAVGVELTYFSPDGDMGFPGNLAVTLRYTLNNDNELRLHYSAVSDADTVINLTNHSYFNLAGAGKATVLEQVAWINADTFTPVSADLIPTGETATVHDTPLDFTTATAIGQRIREDHAQLKYAEPEQGGYDFNWILNTEGDLTQRAAQVTDPASGRVIELYTTEPAVQLYTNNFMDGSLTGKQNLPYLHWGAFTLETQHYPDSPNQPAFPSTLLKQGEKYTQTTIFRFGVN